MACETFLKISQKCAKSLATAPRGTSSFMLCRSYWLPLFCVRSSLSPEVPCPLIDGIIPQLPELYALLETPKQQLMLYEGAGHMIGSAECTYSVSVLSRLFLASS